MGSAGSLATCSGRLTSRVFIQVENVYGVGDTVYVKDECHREKKLYIDKIKNGIYKLRESETAGEDVLDEDFRETDLRETPWT